MAATNDHTPPPPLARHSRPAMASADDGAGAGVSAGEETGEEAAPPATRPMHWVMVRARPALAR